MSFRTLAAEQLHQGPCSRRHGFAPSDSVHLVGHVLPAPSERDNTVSGTAGADDTCSSQRHRLVKGCVGPTATKSTTATGPTGAALSTDTKGGSAPSGPAGSNDAKVVVGDVDGDDACGASANGEESPQQRIEKK